METCEHKGVNEENCVFEYKWIINYFWETIQSSQITRNRIYEIASRTFKSRNYEWSVILSYMKSINPSHGIQRKFIIDISGKSLSNIFQKIKFEILIDSIDNDDNSIKREEYLNYNINNLRVFLFPYDRINEFINENNLIVVFRVHDLPFSMLNYNEINKLTSDYEKLLKSGDNSDFKIVIGEKEFLVHKLILSTRSDYFSAMFKYGTKEQTSNVVEISDISHEVMSEVLRYIYCAKVNIQNNFVYDLLTAADKYQIICLKRICENSVINDLNTINIEKCMIYAEQYNNENLKIATSNFLLKNASEFSEDNIELLRSNLL